MKFYLTVWSTSWASSMKVMKTLGMSKAMKMLRMMKMKNKHQNQRSQNQKERTVKLPVTHKQVKSHNAKTNDDRIYLNFFKSNSFLVAS